MKSDFDAEAISNSASESVVGTLHWESIDSLVKGEVHDTGI